MLKLQTYVAAVTTAVALGCVLALPAAAQTEPSQSRSGYETSGPGSADAPGALHGKQTPNAAASESGAHFVPGKEPSQSGSGFATQGPGGANASYPAGGGAKSVPNAAAAAAGAHFVPGKEPSDSAPGFATSGPGAANAIRPETQQH